MGNYLLYLLLTVDHWEYLVELWLEHFGERINIILGTKLFEGVGWTPIDVSVAMYTFFRMPIANIGSTINLGLLRDKKRYFGEIERGRVVFSIDPERELAPVYNDIESTTNDMIFPIAEENFAWGYHSISGKAPYMQPIYPQLNKTYKNQKQRCTWNI